MTDSQTTGPAPELTPPEPLPTPPRLPTTGITELDRALSILFTALHERLEYTIDEVYQGLSHAYPGLYADPDAPTQTAVEWRVQQTTGSYAWITGSAAVHAHRMGLRVERRVVTRTAWEVEPNPNRRKPQPIPEHPKVHEAVPDGRLVPPGAPTDPNGNPYEGEPSEGDFRYLDEPVSS